jgi:hypothetical protein
METKIEFESEVYRETMYGVQEEYGKKKCTMELIPVKSEYTIEWVVGDEEEIVEIGIWAVGNKVTEYDGVFSLPKEAIKLLKDNGFDTSEVE